MSLAARLSPRYYKLFLILQGNQGEYISAEDLAKAMFGLSRPTEVANIRVYIQGVRQGLAGLYEIHNAWGHGYRLVQTGEVCSGCGGSGLIPREAGHHEVQSVRSVPDAAPQRAAVVPPVPGSPGGAI